MQFPLETVREVAQILQNQDLGEITLETGGARLTLKRPSLIVAAAPAPASETALAGEAQTAEADSSALAPATSITIASPAVGVFREGKNPPQIGAEVAKKAVLGAVETLNIPTELTAPQAARVVEILAIEGQRVEWGQPLLVLEPLEPAKP